MYLSNGLIALMLTALFKCVQSVEMPHLKGVTIVSPPFVSLNNGHFEGFAIDLINEIAKIGKFRYTLYTSPDGKYGSPEKYPQPSGIVEEIFMRRADFALADLTKSVYRERYMIFSEPFMTLHLNALINKKYVGNMSSFEDLLNQTKIKYGTLREGETYRFMANNRDPTLGRIYHQIYSNDYLLVNSRREGIERALHSQYAFIQESVANNYAVDQSPNCELTVIEGKRNDPNYLREYAIGLQTGQQNNTRIFNDAIHQLKSSGQLDRLRRKYWSQKCNGSDSKYSVSSMAAIAMMFISYILIN